MVQWVTLVGHCQEQSIFMLNLQEEMHYICLLVCLFIYCGSELFFTLLVMWLWGNDYHGGKVAVKASVCLGGVGWGLHTSQNVNTV